MDGLHSRRITAADVPRIIVRALPQTGRYFFGVV
jgi:hypothetical protein